MRSFIFPALKHLECRLNDAYYDHMEKVTSMIALSACSLTSLKIRGKYAMDDMVVDALYAMPTLNSFGIEDAIFDADFLMQFVVKRTPVVDEPPFLPNLEELMLHSATGFLLDDNWIVDVIESRRLSDPIIIDDRIVRVAMLEVFEIRFCTSKAGRGRNFTADSHKRLDQLEEEMDIYLEIQG